MVKTSKLSQTKGTKKRPRKTPLSAEERRVMKKIGLQVNYDLSHNPRVKRPVEQLSFDSDISRAAIYEITGGRGNPKLLTIYKIAKSLGYKKISELLLAAGL